MKQKNRRFFRWIQALLVTVLVLASLAGCGQSEAARGASAASETTARPQTAASEAGNKPRETTEAKKPEAGNKPRETTEAKKTEPALSVEENGTYTSKEEVALYLHIYGELPSNFITKKEAEDLGWKKKSGHAGDLDVVAPGMSIGGSHFGNYEGQLPEEKGRKYYECDINYRSGSRGAERIIYSNDGLIFYTGDHYKTFEQLYPEEE